TDTQLIRLGGPNFHQIPINQPVCPFHNNQRDGYLKPMSTSLILTCWMRLNSFLKSLYRLHQSVALYLTVMWKTSLQKPSRWPSVRHILYRGLISRMTHYYRHVCSPIPIHS
ncbi:catalase, partial [Staphylococcus aureus]